MSEISIQVRRVTERVKQYYSIFGLRPYARMRPGRSVIRGSKRLGFDEIECVVAETARGTSVGFYAINQLQGLFHSIPLFLVLLVTTLAQIPSIGSFLTGDGDQSLPFNLPKLLVGNYSFNFIFVALVVALGAIFAITEVIIQRIRLDIIKSRFSFYSRDAVWDTKEVPQSVISLQAIRSVFSHAWMLAIIYFGIFASNQTILTDLSQIYKADQKALYTATIDGFVITVGLVLGLLTSYKAISLRKQYGRTDDRNRISGGLTERRIDPILYGIQSSLMGGVIFLVFMSVTILSSATAIQMGQFLFFVLVGGGIAGAIQSEGDAWIMASYAVFVFFTSLVLIFRTGAQPAYAYIVVLQLFFIPIPFIILLSLNFDTILKGSDIRSSEWYFDVFPLTSFISLFLKRRKEAAAKRAYEDSLQEEISLDSMDTSIKIDKQIFSNSSSNAYKMVRHYFELLFTYTASFEETNFVTLPSFSQLNSWWVSKTGSGFDNQENAFVKVTDQLLWDPRFQPDDASLSGYETAGRQMVLEIQ